MKIGIIGTGNMGRVLGTLWAELGHEVLFGARDPKKAAEAVDLCEGRGAGSRASAGSNDAAAAFGEIVFYNPRDVAVRDVLERPDCLDGKVVIDSHNGPMPKGFDLVHVPRSRAEVLQQQIPEAHVVKAFNTMAQEVFEHCPTGIAGAGVSAFLASDSRAALGKVSGLVRQMGMAPVDCGALSAARHLESLGDFIRSLIAARSDVMTTISVHSLPAASKPRFGPRSATWLP